MTVTLSPVMTASTDHMNIHSAFCSVFMFIFDITSIEILMVRLRCDNFIYLSKKKQKYLNAVTRISHRRNGNYIKLLYVQSKNKEWKIT